MRNLLQELPPLEGARNDDDGARAVLRVVVEPAAAVDFDFRPVPADPATCPNCGAMAGSTRSPYCGEACRAMAAFVRQFRSNLSDGSILTADKQIGLGQALWALLGGGFPRRLALVTPKERAKVIARERGICQGCGAAATTIDHAKTACNRPINLRAVCENCSREKDFGAMALDAAVVSEIAMRVASPEPIRCCDDAATWDWRAYVRLR